MFHVLFADRHFETIQLFKSTWEKFRNERPYSCPDCKKAFKRSSHLKDHLVLHSDTKPFKCKFCNSSFAAKTSLRLHNFIHTNEKPYRCEKCEQAFRQPHHLKSHTFYHHTDEKKEACNVCHKSFSNMKMHMRNHSIKAYYICELYLKLYFNILHGSVLIIVYSTELYLIVPNRTEL